MARQQIRHVYKSWAWEIHSLGVSIALLGGMFGVLFYFNRKPIFLWHGVTLNAVISIISMASKACLLFAIAEAVSQWKWILFAQGKRPLIDFERIDRASRGVAGCFTLMVTVSKGFFLKIGATLVILSLAFEPFSQQLIQYGQDMIWVTELNKTNAVTYRTNVYSEGKWRDGEEDAYLAFAEPNFLMQASIMTGLATPSEKIVQQLPFTCPTGNCTWNPFDTLAVCHRCINVTDGLQRSSGKEDLLMPFAQAGTARPFNDRGNTSGFMLPNGHYIANYDGCRLSEDSGWCHRNQWYLLTSFGTGDPEKTNGMKDLDTLIWSMSVIKPATYKNESESQPYLGEWPSIPLEAMECGLYYCVNSYTSSVEGNELRESSKMNRKIVRLQSSLLRTIEFANSTYENAPHTLDTLEYNATLSNYFRLPLMLSQLGNGTTYNISVDAIYGISAFFQRLFLADTPNITQPMNMSTTNGTKPVFANGFIEGSGFTVMRNNPAALETMWSWNEYKDLRSIFEALAISMSNAIRSHSMDDPTSQVKGQVGKSVTVFDIHWYWFMLHLSLLFGVSAFLVLTILVSNAQEMQQVPAWKSNSLAVLNHGWEVHDALDGAITNEDLDNNAAHQTVSLKVDGLMAEHTVIAKDRKMALIRSHSSSS